MSSVVSRERTRNYLRQIQGAAVFKVIAMAASFVAIPLMIHYLGHEQFGVWATLLTVMSWIVFFDLGIGNGVRNKVAEALARSQSAVALSFIASGYCLIGLIAIILWLIGTVASFFIPWQTVFNTQLIPESTLQHTVQVAIFFIVLNFWIGLIGAILGAVQKTAMIALGQLISNTLALLLVLVLYKSTTASITYLAYAYGSSLVTPNLILSIWFYRQHPELRPTPYLNKHHVLPLLSVGLQFFTIQLAVLVIFTTDKMLITQLFGPQYVTQYEVIFKIFSVITFAHALISAPLWSAYTDAYHRSDMAWIKSMLNRQLLIYGGVVLAVVAVAIAAKPIIALWIGSDIEVSLSLVAGVSMLVLVSTWVNIYAIFLNGTQKIKVSLVVSIFAMLFNIPMSITLAKYTSLGVSSIIFGTILVLLPGVILGPYQTIKIIKGQDAGIWGQ